MARMLNGQMIDDNHVFGPGVGLRLIHFSSPEEFQAHHKRRVLQEMDEDELAQLGFAGAVR